MLTLAINRQLESPVYAQVADQLRHFISSGSLLVDTVLPSVRQLAGDLGVNLNTIARAYRLLEAEGFLVIRDRVGVRVAAPAEKVEDGVRAKLEEDLRGTLSRLKQAGVSNLEIRRLLRREFDALGLLEEGEER